MPISDYRTALVTGANTGMGEAFTRMLSESGVQVYGVARNATKLQEVADATGMKPIVWTFRPIRHRGRRGGLEIDIWSTTPVSPTATSWTPPPNRWTRWST